MLPKGNPKKKSIKWDGTVVERAAGSPKKESDTGKEAAPASEKTPTRRLEQELHRHIQRTEEQLCLYDQEVQKKDVAEFCAPRG